MSITIPAIPRRRSALADFVTTQPTGAVAAAVILTMLLAGIFADQVAPYDPLEINYGAMLAAPDADHWLGTDGFGRDILSRIIYGARTALTLGVTASVFGCSVGALVGITSAYYGGVLDSVVQRIVDTLLSFPLIFLALITLAVLGRHLVLGIDINLAFAIALPIMPSVARVIRSSALTIRTLPYVDAARASGFRDSRIILRHIAPNVAAPYLIMVTAFIAQAILLEASLSFLGLGVAEPTPAWGLMLSGNAADFYRDAPWIIAFPGLAISLAVFAFNFLGDSLRDWLDPKLRN